LIVLAAVALMIRLGFWQLDRLHQKESMLADYQKALHDSKVVDFRSDLMVDGPGFYRRVRLECVSDNADKLVSGRNAAGLAGWAHRFGCEFPYHLKGTAKAEVTIGWSAQPQPVSWSGGMVAGTLVPSIGPVHRVVADPPLAGLQPNARPDPAELPNNHFAYAVQWFLFAGVALVIYALAMRKRLRP
jgi:cytochrome oxidase assembly protein ShyY1